MIERIDSLYDLSSIQKEVDTVVAGLATSQKALTDLYSTVKSFKGSELTKLADSTTKLVTVMDEAATASAKTVMQNRQLVESAKAQSTAILGGADSYAFFANSVQEVIRQQLKLNTQLAGNKDKLKENEAAFKAGKLTIDQYKDTQIELVESQKRMRLENQELTKSINLQIKQNSTTGGSLEDLKNQYNALYDVFKKLSESERGSSFGQQLSADLGTLKSNINEIQKSAGNFSDNVGRYAGSFKEAFGVLEQELIKVRQQLSTMDPKAAGFNELAKQEKLLTTLTDGLNKEFTNQNQEIRALQRAAESLGVQLGNQNEIFTEFKDKVGEGVDAIGDIRAQIKLAASDTRTLDGLIGVAEGLAGAYGAAQGAAALFGAENEDLQKTFVKLQAVMTILQGLQAVRNALQSESAAMDAINIARTKALTIAQAAYTFVVGTSTGAMKAFRIALAGTGIGLLVIALGYLVSKMDLFSDSVEEANKKLEDQQDAAEKTANALDKVASASERVRNSNKGGIDDLKRELELLKAKGAGAGEVFAKEQSIRQVELLNLKALALTYQGTYEARKKQGRLTAQDAQVLSDKINEINKSGQDKANEIEAAKLAFQKELSDKATKAAEEASKKRLDYLNKEAKAAYEIIKMRLEREANIQKGIADDENKMYAERIQALQNYETLQRQLIEAEKNFQLSSEKLTTSERLKVRVEAEIKLNDVYQSGSKERMAIIKKQIADEKEQYDQLAQYFAELPDKIKEKAKTDSEKLLSGQFFMNDQEYSAELQRLTDNLKQQTEAAGKNQEKLTESFEEYQKGKDKISREFAMREIARQEQLLNMQISKAKFNGLDTTELQKQLNEFKNAYNELAAQGYQADATNFVNGLSDKDKAYNKWLIKFQADSEVFTKVQEDLSQAALEIFSIGIDKQKVALDELEAAQQKNYENEIKRINASSLSDEQKADKLKILEAERQAQKEENERKTKQLEIKRAQFEKASSISSIITGTAIAVVNALGAKPWTPANIALASAVGAIGLAQLARAIATPLPKYAKGTDSHPGGYAVVGEIGREIIKEPGKRPYLSPATATILPLARGTQVIPANEVKRFENNDMLRESTGKLKSLNKAAIIQDNTSAKIAELTDAVKIQTQLTIREMRKQKKPAHITNVIDLGYAEYRKRVTLNDV